MSTDELLDERVSVSQSKRAVDALHANQTKRAAASADSQLLPGKQQHVWLTVSLKELPPKHKLKPGKIPIVHPIVDPRTASICLITKDPQREYKDRIEQSNVKFISRVVGLSKLKGKFRAFEPRRVLLQNHDLFLADERIVPMLPKLLGNKWFDAKKQPIPVNLERKDLKGTLERAISSTYMTQNRGTFVSIKIGTLAHTPAQILANLKTALPAVAAAIHGGWDNIQSFGIKTSGSANLPIWSCNLDDKQGGRWNGLTTVSESEGEDDSEDDAMDVDEAKPSVSKGKKRGADEDKEEEKEKPKKKAKSSETPSTVAKPLSKAAKPVSTVKDVAAQSKKRKATEDAAASSAEPSSANSASPKRPKKSQDSNKPPRPPVSTKAAPSKPDIAADLAATLNAAAASITPAKKSKADVVASTPTPASESKKSKKNKNKAEVAEAPVPAPPPPTPAAADAAGSKKRKKNKGEAATPESPAVSTKKADVEEPPTAATPMSKKEKKKKSQVEEVAPAVAVAAAEPSSKKEKKKKAQEEAAAVEVISEAIESVKKPKKEKKKKAQEELDAVEPVAEVVEPTPKSKKEKKVKAADEEVLKDKDIVADAPKKKSGDKKKEKTVKIGGGKSVKDGFLGKKAGRS